MSDKPVKPGTVREFYDNNLFFISLDIRMAISYLEIMCVYSNLLVTNRHGCVASETLRKVILKILKLKKNVDFGSALFSNITRNFVMSGWRIVRKT